ncbi:MAG: DUF3606 domain-containing protein [Rudaea sp.]
MQLNLRCAHSRFLPTRIDLRDPDCVNSWCRRLDVTRQQLRAVVACVGSNPDVVRGYLCRSDFTSFGCDGNLPVPAALRCA